MLKKILNLIVNFFYINKKSKSKRKKKKIDDYNYTIF